MPDITRYWYRESLHPFLLLLLPISWLFGRCVALRRWLYRVGLFKTHQLSVPVIVVGNITIGGTGKTPFVIWLANYLRSHGYSPGIVTRGYGGRKHHEPHRVESHSSPDIVGDEALILARHAHCPVMVGINRPAAAEALLKESQCHVIISDDGLQHYRLDRDIEIVVVDGVRRFGNQQLLPAGPLREPLTRLAEADFVIVNGGDADTMQLSVNHFVALKGDRKVTIDQFAHQTVHAVAGIGNPERFFSILRQAEINIIPHVFSDHYQYSPNDLKFGDNYPILMTEKDAVKCELFADECYWYLSVSAKIDPAFQEQLLSKLHTLEGSR